MNVNDTVDERNCHLRWGESVPGIEEGDWIRCTIPREAVRWVRVKRGDYISSKAVLAGKTKTDEGVVFVARQNGYAGKINTSNGKEDGAVHNFWAHDVGSSKTEMEILLVFAEYLWKPIKRGDAMPPNACRVGMTPKDGENFVGRACEDGEPGKINTGDGKTGEKGTMWNFWTHSSGSSQEAQILIIQPTEADWQEAAVSKAEEKAREEKLVTVQKQLDIARQMPAETRAMINGGYEPYVAKLEKEEKELKEARKPPLPLGSGYL